jgi:hypothetical protein
MPSIDLLINSRIRAILARHWVDAEKLQFRTTAGTVRFHGVLARQGAVATCDIDSTLVEVLINEIRRIEGVQKVYFTGVEIERRDHKVGVNEEGEIDSHQGMGKRTMEARRKRLKI